jgi:hypothetical protein
VLVGRIHPIVGAVTLDVQQFVDTHPDQLLVAHTAPDSASQEALRFLLQWTPTNRSAPRGKATTPQ